MGRRTARAKFPTRPRKDSHYSQFLQMSHYGHRQFFLNWLASGLALDGRVVASLNRSVIGKLGSLFCKADTAIAGA